MEFSKKHISWLILAVAFICLIFLLTSGSNGPNSESGAHESKPSETSEALNDRSLSDKDWEYISVLALDIEKQAKVIHSMSNTISSLNQTIETFQNELQRSAQKQPELADTNQAQSATQSTRESVQDTTGNLNENSLKRNPWKRSSPINQSLSFAQAEALSTHSLAAELDITSTANNTGTLEMIGVSDYQLSKSVTIPVGTIALDTFLLTTLIGRVPSGGGQHASFPFKVMINGSLMLGFEEIDIDVHGAVAMGSASGDFLLSCAIGTIIELAVVKNNQYFIASATDNAPIGYLTTDTGHTCLPGQLVTTVPKVIGGSALLAAGGSLSQQQTGQAVESAATSSSNQLFNPLAVDLLRTSALEKVLSDSSHWWYDKLQDQYDAVIVPSGTRTILHFSKSVALTRLTP